MAGRYELSGAVGTKRGSSRNSGELAFNVIAGLDPAIHVFPRKVYWQQWVGRPHVDARVKRG
ncbi:MAG TPA: hypothetical protein VK196_09555, partial [Magnetospirillum sp.]|nr:hypothetical protein [Magnetospirillum sp.]